MNKVSNNGNAVSLAKSQSQPNLKAKQQEKNQTVSPSGGGTKGPKPAEKKSNVPLKETFSTNFQTQIKKYAAGNCNTPTPTQHVDVPGQLGVLAEDTRASTSGITNKVRATANSIYEKTQFTPGNSNGWPTSAAKSALNLAGDLAHTTAYIGAQATDMGGQMVAGTLDSAAAPVQTLKNLVAEKQNDALKMSQMSIMGGAPNTLATYYKSQLISHLPGALDTAEALGNVSLTSTQQTDDYKDRTAIDRISQGASGISALAGTAAGALNAPRTLRGFTQPHGMDPGTPSLAFTKPDKAKSVNASDLEAPAPWLELEKDIDDLFPNSKMEIDPDATLIEPISNGQTGDAVFKNQFHPALPDDVHGPTRPNELRAEQLEQALDVYKKALGGTGALKIDMPLETIKADLLALSQTPSGREALARMVDVKTGKITIKPNLNHHGLPRNNAKVTPNGEDILIKYNPGHDIGASRPDVVLAHELEHVGQILDGKLDHTPVKPGPGVLQADVDAKTPVHEMGAIGAENKYREARAQIGEGEIGVIPGDENMKVRLGYVGTPFAND